MALRCSLASQGCSSASKYLRTTCSGPPFLFARVFFGFAGVFCVHKDKSCSQGCSLNSLGSSISAIRAKVMLCAIPKTCSYLSDPKRLHWAIETFPAYRLQPKTVCTTHVEDHAAFLILQRTRHGRLPSTPPDAAIALNVSCR